MNGCGGMPAVCLPQGWVRELLWFVGGEERCFSGFYAGPVQQRWPWGLGIAGLSLNVSWLHELRDRRGESTICRLASGLVGPRVDEAGTLILGVRPPRDAQKMTVMRRCCQPLRDSAPPGEACGPWQGRSPHDGY